MSRERECVCVCVCVCVCRKRPSFCVLSQAKPCVIGAHLALIQLSSEDHSAQNRRREDTLSGDLDDADIVDVERLALCGTRLDAGLGNQVGQEVFVSVPFGGKRGKTAVENLFIDSEEIRARRQRV